MRHTLTSMFAGLFRKQGFDVTEYECLELMDFESYWIKGQVMFDKDKVHRVRWRCKPGYYLYDAPFAPGHTSVEFKKVHDLLLFLQRRLVWKKK